MTLGLSVLARPLKTCNAVDSLHHQSSQPRHEHGFAKALNRLTIMGAQSLAGMLTGPCLSMNMCSVGRQHCRTHSARPRLPRVRGDACAAGLGQEAAPCLRPRLEGIAGVQGLPYFSCCSAGRMWMR